MNTEKHANLLYSLIGKQDMKGEHLYNETVFLQALKFHITKQSLKMTYKYGYYVFTGDQIRNRDFLHTVDDT